MTKKYILLCNNELFTFDNGKNMADINAWRRVLCVWNDHLECFYLDKAGDDIEHVDDLMRLMLKSPTDVHTQSMVNRRESPVSFFLKELVE
jgi:hypothetical protein